MLLLALLSFVGPSLQVVNTADRKTAAGKKSKEVAVAPEADLANGIDDVDSKGKRHQT